MRAECFGQLRAQDGRQQTLNQDAFVIGRGRVAWMALCDGAGNAQSVGKRALGLLEMHIGEASLGQLLGDEAWLRWAKSLDSALLGGPEATLVAAAVVGLRRGLDAAGVVRHRAGGALHVDAAVRGQSEGEECFDARERGERSHRHSSNQPGLASWSSPAAGVKTPLVEFAP